MSTGILVRRTPAWGDWVKHNPWMYTKKDFEIGIVLIVDTDYCKVLWSSSGSCWEDRSRLLAIDMDNNQSTRRSAL